MNTATKYGNYAAAFSIMLILLLHYSGMSSFWVKGVGSLITGMADLVFLFMAIYFTRKNEFNGTIDFRSAARAGVTFVLINAIVFAFFQYIYYRYIEPNFMSRFLPEYEKWLKLMVKDEERVQKIIDALSTGFTPISAAWSSFSQMIFWETFIGLIIARLLRSSAPKVS
jgi:hypothetical protein